MAMKAMVLLFVFGAANCVALQAQAEVDTLDSLADVRTMMGEAGFRDTFDAVLPVEKHKSMAHREEDALTAGIAGAQGSVGEIIKSALYHTHALGEAAPDSFAKLTAKKTAAAHAKMQAAAKKQQKRDSVKAPKTNATASKKATHGKKKAPAKVTSKVNTKAGSKERIGSLRVKIEKASAREKYAKHVSVAHKAREMGHKVKFGSRAAQAAGATVKQMAGKAPRLSGSARQLVNERIHKAKARLRVKELKGKARRVARIKGPKKIKRRGAEVSVELAASVKAAKQAMQHMHANPGDKDAEVATGKALQHVQMLTAELHTATQQDSNLQEQAAQEIANKLQKVRESKELAKKRRIVQQERQYAEAHKRIEMREQKKERLEQEVRQADAVLRLKKKIAALSMRREKQRLAARDFSTRESMQKGVLKTHEKDVKQTIKTRENNAEMSESFKERSKKKRSQSRERSEKKAQSELNQAHRDERRKIKASKLAKKRVLQLITNAQKLRESAKRNKVSNNRLEREKRHVKRVLRRVERRARLTKTAMRTDETRTRKLKKKLAKDAARDKRSKERQDAAQKKAKAKAKRLKLKSARTRYKMKSKLWERLKRSVEAEVNGPYKRGLEIAAARNVDLKAALTKAMESSQTKTTVQQRVAKALRKKLHTKVFSVPEAQQLQKLITARVRNDIRNKIWVKITNQYVKRHPKSASKSHMREGVYVKRSAMRGKAPKRTREKRKVAAATNRANKLKAHKAAKTKQINRASKRATKKKAKKTQKKRVGKRGSMKAPTKAPKNGKGGESRFAMLSQKSLHKINKGSKQLSKRTKNNPLVPRKKAKGNNKTTPASW